MPAPTNISAATAVDLGPLPNSIVQTVDDAGTTYTVWYKYTPLVDGELGIWPFGDLSVYKPTLRTFTPDGVTPSTILSDSTNKRVQLPVKAGQTYYFRLTSSTGNVSPAVLTISALMFTPSSVPAGSILINSETTGFPASILDAAGAAADPIAFQYPFAAGDSCSILPNGISCFEDDDLAHDGSGSSTGITLYDANRVEITTISRAALGLPTGNLSICNDDVDTFYVGMAGSGATHAKIVTVSSAGVVGGTSWTLPSAGLQCIGVSPDETILYHMGQGSTSGAALKRWDLINDVALSDLAAGVATYTPFHDLLVFPDGSLLVGYRASGDGFLRHYSSAGAAINQFEQGTTLRSDDRLAFALDNPTSFWLWRHRGPLGTALGLSQFDNIRLSDGTVLDSKPGAQYDAGVYAAAVTATPTAEFGHPFSCGFVILRTVPVTPPVLPEPGSQIDNSVPCCDATGGGSSTGPVTPSVTPFWYPRCIGGGVVPSAADVVEPEDWHDETPPKEPNGWLTIVGQAGSPVEADERWGLKPLSDRERFVAGRLLEIGSIERRSSDKFGNYAPARMRLVAQDDDGTFRERLGDPDRRELFHREARYEVSSYAARKAGLDPIPRMQGRIVDVQPGLDRTAVVELQDVVGSQFGPLDPQKTVGREVGDEHPAKPESSKGRIYNILLGEKSDAGKTDSTGASVSVGAMPVVDCGDEFLDGATPDPEGRLFNDALTAVDDKSDVNLTGTGGTITYPTRVFVAPIIGGEIGPFSNVPTGFLDPDGSGFGGPSDPHAHRAVWMDIAGGADEYLAVFTKVAGFHPKDNPTVDTNARYKTISGTPSMPAFPPRNGGVGPQWDFNADFLDDADGDQWGVQMISAPLNLNYTITGTPGTTRYVYAVSALATLGESPRSAVLVVEDGPAVLNGTDNIVLTWDEPADHADAVIGYRVRGRQTNPPTMYLRITEIGVSPIPLTYTDDGTDAEKTFNSGSDGDALVSENVWGWMAGGQGDGEAHEVYGSDGAEGDTPKRRLIGWDEGTILGPTSTGWPHAERYRVVGGIRQFGFYARGLPLKHHREGAVTFAFNGCGPEDADGLLINQAFRMLLYFLQMVEKNNGEGYLDGDIGPIETFANGDPKFKTTEFEAAQQQTIDWLTPESPQGLGYIGTIVVTEPTPLAEVIRRFFNDYGGHLTSNHRGQVYPFLPNPEPEAGAGRLYAERREIARLVNHWFAKDERENRIVYAYDYNFDTQSFRVPNVVTEDAASIAAAGGAKIGVFQTGLKECFYANDQTTIEDRWARHLTLYAYAPRYVEWATNLKSLADANGQPARFTHRKEGLGLNGESGTPGVILHTTENHGRDAKEVLQTALLFRSEGSP